MLVRHVLSQLSYAPELSFSEVFLSATWFIIAGKGRFVKHYFSIFSQNFSTYKPAHFPQDQILFSRSAKSSGVKVYTVSQNWHSTGKGLPSSMISVSSLRPRLISAASTRSREQ